MFRFWSRYLRLNVGGRCSVSFNPDMPERRRKVKSISGPRGSTFRGGRTDPAATHS